MCKQYYLTSEDFHFIYNLLNQERNSSSVELFMFMLQAWDSIDNRIFINKLPLSPSTVKKFIENNFSKPPKIALNGCEIWSAIYYKSKDFIFKLHHYFKPKGFDLMEQFSENISINNINYKMWCILPIYISYLTKANSDHIPSPKNIFNTIEFLSNNDKKHVCPMVLSLLSYIANRSNIYNSEITIDLFVKFTVKQHSIPKTQIKKYEALLENLEQLNKTYWDEQVSKNPKLQDRLLKKNTTTYDMDEEVIRRWNFDVHNLSIKNGNFNVKIMKDNFNNFYNSSNILLSQKILILSKINYDNSNAIIKIEALSPNHDVGLKELNKFQKVLEIIYEHSRTNISLSISDIDKIWENICLMDDLQENLNFKSDRKKIIKM